MAILEDGDTNAERGTTKRIDGTRNISMIYSFTTKSECVYTCTSPLCLLGQHRSNYETVAMSTFSTQTLVSKYYSPLKRIRTPCKSLFPELEKEQHRTS